MSASTRATKPSGLGWAGDIPAHWNIDRIGRLAIVGNGSTPQREEERYWADEDNGFPWLNSSRINDERISKAHHWVSEQAFRECHLPRVPAQSVVIAITGEGQTRGRAALLEIDATISQHLAYLRPIGSIRPRFLWRQLQAIYSWLRDESSGVGSTRAALTCEFLRTVAIVIPPIVEQEGISDVLDLKTAAVDNLLAKKEQMMMLLGEQRQAFITERVTPDHPNTRDWKRSRLAWVIREVQRPVVVEPEVRYAEIGVRSHGRGTFHKDPVFGWELEEKKVYWVEPGDLVFNIVFAWERAVAIIQEVDRGRIASHRFPTYRAVGDAANMRFLRYLFMSDYGRFLLDQNSPGAAGRNRTLDRSSLLKEEVYLPDVAAQRSIADDLDNALRLIDRSSAALEEQIARLREYRQVLITAAVTGKLDVGAAPMDRVVRPHVEANIA